MSAAGRVTVTLRCDLLKQIDRVESSRSRFIALAVEHELQRRRRAALLESVANPHHETAHLADAGMGNWTIELPENNDLVDLSTGTAVRWIEGQGWVPE
jgi:hypothetical protein